MQLILVLLLLFVIQLKDLFAENVLSVRTMDYKDSNNVIIWETLVLYQTDLSQDTQLGFQYGYDSVSAASASASAPVNSISGPSSIGAQPVHIQAASTSDLSNSNDASIKERNSGAFYIAQNYFNLFKGTTSVLYSTKSDYQSYTLGQSITVPLGTQTTFSVGGFYTNNANAPAVTTTDVYLLPPSNQSLDSHQYTGIVSVEQILSSVSKIKCLVDFYRQSGYLSSGYQQVPIETGTTSGAALESLPDYRAGGSLSLIYSHWLGDQSAIHFKSRYYIDSFGINAYSLETKYRKYLSDDLILELSYRYLHQSEASFWGNWFPTLPDTSFTNQYALSEIAAHHVGTGLRYEASNSLTYNGQIEGYVAGSFNFIALSGGVEYHF